MVFALLKYYDFNMKRSDTPSSAIAASVADFRLITTLCAGLATFGSTSFALTESNPYSPIVGRNVFALKPPTPVNNTPVAPVVAAPGIELQGITTILGRPQVLLKIKLPPRPPEPAKDQSFVLDVGQREGEVEVVSINMDSGTIQLRNQGSDLVLNMKDNAAKPAAGAALPGATAMPSGVPSLPAPNLGLPPSPRIPNATPASGGASVAPIGGSSSIPLPTRQLRSPTSGPNPGDASGINNLSTGSPQSSGYQPPNTGLSIEEQMAILAVQKEANHDGTAALLPPIPPRYQPK